MTLHPHDPAPRAAGQLDVGFGNAGITTLAIDYAEAITRDTHDRILVAGQAQGGFRLTRLNPDGTPDVTFGQGGVADGSFGPENISQVPSGLAVSQDKILVIGSHGSTSEQGHPAAARFHQNGARDTSFGDGGGRVYRLLEGRSTAPTLQALSVVDSPAGAGSQLHWAEDGSVVFSYLGFGVYRNQGLLIKITDTGELDSGFADNGFVQFTVENLPTDVRGLVVKPNGHIVVAGTAGDNPYFSAYTPDGLVDRTFGVDGTHVSPTPGRLRGLALQANGGVVGVGYTGSEGLVVALDGEGQPNATFNNGDPLRLKPQFEPLMLLDVQVRLDNLLVIGGNTSSRFGVLYRLKPTGEPDPSFNGTGFVGRVGEMLKNINVQDDSKILVTTGYAPEVTVRRYLGAIAT
ncbi:hypothetical protein [Pseudomonas eucalypticola]|uniref:Delta-60 repeat domain-containing protein n=1 Tax=Pseudomonas eucalypticola TaxID=2599595 RepID=A0A7D5D964_9PSED|nr:hypothetical protein [Pseudomonas eucalypticola]QKZ06619.1 hypothetical protein HWQ56_23710 [Pseudomonas eucalypticola]